MSSLLVSETMPCALHPAIPVRYKDDTVGVSLTTPHIYYIGHYWSTGVHWSCGCPNPHPYSLKKGHMLKAMVHCKTLSSYVLWQRSALCSEQGAVSDMFNCPKELSWEVSHSVNKSFALCMYVFFCLFFIKRCINCVYCRSLYWCPR